MNKFMKYLSFFAIVALAFVATDAFAGDGGNADPANLGNGKNVFTTVLDRMIVTFQNVRAVIFIVGGFGLVGLAFAAIFGKVKWSWLAALAVGLAIVAAAGAIVDYVTQSDAASGGGRSVADMSDTFYD
jgi:type IV secretory pathway VirB2 component (pilin)